MNQFFTITITTLKMLIRNKQTLIFTFMVPLLIMVVIGYVTGSGSSSLNLGIVEPANNPEAQAVIEQMQKIDAFKITTGSLDEEKEALQDSKRDLVLVFPEGFSIASAATQPQSITLFENIANPIQSGIGQSVIQNFFKAMQDQQTGTTPWFTFDKQQVQSSDIRYIDFLAYGIIGMTIMQLGIFSTAFAIVESKAKGVLKRVMATPIAPWQYIMGNMVARLILSLGQSAVIILVAVLLFDVNVGHWAWFVTIITLGNIVFLSLGLFISGIAKSIESVPIIGNLIVFPMLLLGNVFFATSSLPAWLAGIVDKLPIAALTNLLRQIIVLDQPITKVWGSLLTLIIWAVVALILANSFFKLQEKE